MKSCKPSTAFVAAGKDCPSQSAVAGGDPFGRSRQRLEQIVGWLDGHDAAVVEHGELEAHLQTVGRELLCCLFQEHLDLRAAREQRLDGVADGDGVERRAVEQGHRRALASVFGEVSVDRLAYRQRGEQNMYVADGALNLPEERASHGSDASRRSKLRPARLSMPPGRFANTPGWRSASARLRN